MPSSAFGHSYNHHCSRLWEERGSAVPEQATTYGWLRTVFSSWKKHGQVRKLSFPFDSFPQFWSLLWNTQRKDIPPFGHFRNHFPLSGNITPTTYLWLFLWYKLNLSQHFLAPGLEGPCMPHTKSTARMNWCSRPGVHTDTPVLSAESPKKPLR